MYYFITLMYGLSIEKTKKTDSFRKNRINSYIKSLENDFTIQLILCILKGVDKFINTKP